MGPTHHLVLNVRFRMAKSTVRVKLSFESPHLPPKTLCARRERPEWVAGRKVDFWKSTPSRQKLYVLEEKGIFYFL